MNNVIRRWKIGIYSDGSKTSNGAGGQILAQYFMQKYVAAEYITRKGITGKEVSLFVDSQGEILALHNYISNFKLLKDCKEN